MGENNNSSGGGSGFVLGLMAGTVFGVGLGLLLAPKPGSDLRNELGERARQTGDKLGVRYKEAGETASQWVERGKEAAKRGRNAVERGREVVSHGLEEARRAAKAKKVSGTPDEQPAES